MIKAWHNKHISTKLGIAILGFLLLAVAILIPVLTQPQIFNSRAMYDKYSCSKNYVSFQTGTHTKCVGYVIRTNGSKWYCSNGSHSQPQYNKLISNCYFFPGISINNGRISGHQACSAGYHLFSAIKTSPANAKCVKNT